MNKKIIIIAMLTVLLTACGKSDNSDSVKTVNKEVKTIQNVEISGLEKPDMDEMMKQINLQMSESYASYLKDFKGTENIYEGVFEHPDSLYCAEPQIAYTLYKNDEGVLEAKADGYQYYFIIDTEAGEVVWWFLGISADGNSTSGCTEPIQKELYKAGKPCINAWYQDAPVYISEGEIVESIYDDLDISGLKFQEELLTPNYKIELDLDKE